MRRLLPLLLLFLPIVAFGQSIINITQQNCVWRSGDNPAWAAPNLDEAEWQPYDQSANLVHRGGIVPPHFWVRCHADLSSLRTLPHPALQVANNGGAYQLFLNGKEMGGTGNMRTSVFSMDRIRQYPVSPSMIGKSPDTIALKITANYSVSSSSGTALFAGESDALLGRRARQVLAQSRIMLVPALCFFVVGIAGLMLLGLFYYDRSRRELLYLSIICISLAALRANGFCTAANANYSSYLSGGLIFLANLGVSVADILFFFTLARRRVPWLFWVALACVWTSWVMLGGAVFLPPDSAYSIAQFTSTTWIADLSKIGLIFYSTVPFVAFWPWRRIQGRMRPLAALCMVWGAVQFLWFASQDFPYHALGLSNDFASWQGELLEIRAVALAAVLLALLALLFRDQRQVTEERAVLAGEMQAAQDIQRMLVPAHVDTMPGISLEVAFQPMREVGGDFYQVIPQPDGSTLLIVGDVSGKGLKAAMTGTLAIGALRTIVSEHHSPAALLEKLNQQIVRAHQDGFITCLCARIAPDATLTVANAGHLSPYRNGEEIPVDSGLPLGLTEAAEYTEKTIQLNPGDKLTFLSDGVIEARNPNGELYGFERTRTISTQSAEEIARAASTFGQQDDITVLTLTLTPPRAAFA